MVLIWKSYPTIGNTIKEAWRKPSVVYTILQNSCLAPSSESTLVRCSLEYEFGSDSNKLGAGGLQINTNLVGGFTSSEKYENQLGWLFPIYGKIKSVPNHQPDIDYDTLQTTNNRFHDKGEKTIIPSLRLKSVCLGWWNIKFMKFLATKKKKNIVIYH